MNDWDIALDVLLSEELVEVATLEEAQALAERETNPDWWKVWK